VVLDALLFSTIPGWVLDVVYVSLGVGLPVLLYLVPPMWRRDRRSLGAAAGG
jgi:hypothetical protein